MTGSQPMKPAFKHYEYEARPGFAEHNNVNYNAVEAGLAWSRTLGCVRKGFKREADLEEPWVENLKGKVETGFPLVSWISSDLEALGYTSYKRRIGFFGLLESLWNSNLIHTSLIMKESHEDSSSEANTCTSNRQI
jgi:hypothetical protein